jgi:hypothetical protein
VASIYHALNQAVLISHAPRQTRKGEMTSWKAFVPGHSGKLAIDAIDREIAGPIDEPGRSTDPPPDPQVFTCGRRPRLRPARASLDAGPIDGPDPQFVAFLRSPIGVSLVRRIIDQYDSEQQDQ